MDYVRQDANAPKDTSPIQVEENEDMEVADIEDIDFNEDKEGSSNLAESVLTQPQPAGGDSAELSASSPVKAQLSTIEGIDNLTEQLESLMGEFKDAEEEEEEEKKDKELQKEQESITSPVTGCYSNFSHD